MTLYLNYNNAKFCVNILRLKKLKYWIISFFSYAYLYKKGPISNYLAPSLYMNELKYLLNLFKLLCYIHYLLLLHLT